PDPCAVALPAAYGSGRAAPRRPGACCRRRGGMTARPAVPGSGDLRTRLSIDIGRDAADVYRVISDHESDVKWQRAVRRVTKLSPGPVGVGTRYRHTLSLLGMHIDLELEVARTMAALHHAFAISGGSFEFETCASLSPSASGTLMVIESSGQVAGAARLTAIMLVRAMRFSTERDLWTLKRLMEARRL